MNLDWNILYFIQYHMHSPFGDWFMPKVTILGDNGFIWIIFALILIFSKKYRIHGLVMLSAIIIGAIVGNLILKHVFMRARPCWIDPSIPMLIPTDHSFPSGHTLASVINASCLYMANKKSG